MKARSLKIRIDSLNSLAHVQYGIINVLERVCTKYPTDKQFRAELESESNSLRVLQKKCAILLRKYFKARLPLNSKKVKRALAKADKLLKKLDKS